MRCPLHLICRQNYAHQSYPGVVPRVTYILWMAIYLLH